MRIGAKVPNVGSLPAELGIGRMAAHLEAAGFDSLWCSDHVVMPSEVGSSYPFSDDGSIWWDLDIPWYDAVVAMAAMAESTSRAEIGVAVLVLPLRHPIVYAKQMASLDALSGGRAVLGAGAGWLAEEFEALGVDYASRGGRLDEWIALLRACWTGAPPAFDGVHYQLPGGVRCHPVPERTPPVLIGGMSAVALRRAARDGDGWLALQRAGRLDADALAPMVARMREQAEDAGRSPAEVRAILRIIESADAGDRVAAELRALAEAGIDEVVVDTSWDDEQDARLVAERLRDAAK